MSQRERMIANAKRARRHRARRPVVDYQAPVELKIGRGAENRTIDRHQPVLRDIELALTNAFRQDSRVDDEVVADVLRCSIRHTPSELPAARDICCAIEEARLNHGCLSDQQWLDCLRTVYASVRRHSDCRNGSVAYLRFVSMYLV